MKRKMIISLILPLVLSGCNKSFFKVVSSSFAKEYCSCRFVVGQSKKYCHDYASQIVPVSSYSEDGQNKTIQAKALGFISKAIYKDSKRGCSLWP